jgi:hypothetical protein
VFDETCDWDMTLQIIGIVAACSWLACAVIYTLGTFVEWRTQRDGIRAPECMDEYVEGTVDNEYEVVRVRKRDQPSFTTSSLESFSEHIDRGQSKSLNSVSPNFYESQVDC